MAHARLEEIIETVAEASRGTRNGFGIRHAAAVYLEGRRDGPKIQGKPLPPNAIYPVVAQIVHATDARLHELAGEWGAKQHSISAEIAKAVVELGHTEADLKICEKALADHLESFAKQNDGFQPPPVQNVRLYAVAFWILALIFGLAEFALMSGSLERFPLPDWERLGFAAGSAGAAIYFAHMIGSWAARRGKTLGESLFTIVLVAALFALLTATALIRAQVMHQRQGAPVIPPQVQIQHSGGTNDA